MEKKGGIAALFIATAMLMPHIPTYAEGNSVVTDNGITASVQNAEAGETVELELPEGYVEGSLVISYKDSEDKTDIPENIEKQSDGSYSFTMPDYNVYASCLVNTDADKLIVVGTTSSYYVRNDNTLEVSFDVPEGEYSSAEANIPVRAHAYNAKSYYPVTASDLATLTLTLSDESGQNVWSGYRDGSFTGEVPDYSIAWKITNNTNDRKGASHSIDEQNNIITITSSDGAERAAGYYRDTLKGWLSSGQENATASEEDKAQSFWYFDKELAEKINSFTSYAIPESPGRNDTKVEGKTHSEYEPYMLMKNPSNSVYADTVYDFNSYISPSSSFNGGMSRYGSNRFINYEKMESPEAGNGDSNPTAGATNTANLKGYDTLTVDTYYMSAVPSVTTTSGEAYDGVGDSAAVPEGVKAEVVPLMAPYELIESELIDIDGMTKDGSVLAEQTAAVTRSTLRFHNNRVFYNAGCKYTNEAGARQGSYAMIYSPETWSGSELVSVFKSTGVEMNVPYVDKGKGADQTLEIREISDVDIRDAETDPRIAVEYTSSDADLQKYTDVFVNYGPAKAVRTVDPEDGSYTWEIEILLDEIPDSAQYPIEVGVVASNLGKWEKVSGATAETVFSIVKTEEETEYLDVTQAYAQRLTVSREDGRLTVSPKTGEELPQITVYETVRGIDGTLSELRMLDMTTDENGNIIIDIPDAEYLPEQKHELLMWDDTHTPVIIKYNL